MSNADKRTVHTDALATLGTIIDEHQKRDAIHLAVIPAKCASEVLRPGQHVRYVDGDAIGLYPGEDDGIGIVDPFLRGPVKFGERFWLVIYPRVITSLRHVWQHPGIPDEAGTPKSADSAAVAKAKARVAEIADSLADSGSVEEGHGYGEEVPMTYERLMARAGVWLAAGK